MGSGLIYACFAHIDHAHREHSCNYPRIFLLPVCPLESFPFCFFHIASEDEATYKVFGVA